MARPDRDTLKTLADGIDHAAWLTENHVPSHQDASIRARCTICEEWFPCALVSMAALAVLEREDRDMLRDALEAATMKSPAERQEYLRLQGVMGIANDASAAKTIAGMALNRLPA